MNLRIGAFGRQETAAMVLIAAFFSGCFGMDSHALYAGGNASYLVQIIATVQALLLFEGTVWVLRLRGGNDLSALIGASRLKRLPAIPLILALMLAAMQPLESFLLTMTQYVFTDAKQVTACLYLLPCLFLLTALGAETLVRTARSFYRGSGSIICTASIRSRSASRSVSLRRRAARRSVLRRRFLRFFASARARRTG